MKEQINDDTNNIEEKIMTAYVTEVRDNSFLIKPTEGSEELNSSDLFDVPVVNADPSEEPEAGDLIEVRYTGSILETYPATLENVTHISVLKSDVSHETTETEPDAQDIKKEESASEALPSPAEKAIMHGGYLYLYSGNTEESIKDHFCIFLTSSSCSEYELPSENQQCNFSPERSVRYQITEEGKTLIAELEDGSFALFETETADSEIVATDQPYFITITCYVEKVTENGSFIVTPNKASQEYGVHGLILVDHTTDGSVPDVGNPYEVKYKGSITGEDPAVIEELVSAVRVGFSNKISQ